MNSWQETPINLIFSHVVKFLYMVGDVPKDLYEISNDALLLDEVILKIYGYKPLDHPFKLFQLEDINGFPFIQVVAESVTVIKELN